MVHYIRRGCRGHGRSNGQLNILSFVVPISLIVQLSAFSLTNSDYSRTIGGRQRSQYFTDSGQSFGGPVHVEYVGFPTVVVVI